MRPIQVIALVLAGLLAPVSSLAQSSLDEAEAAWYEALAEDARLQESLSQSRTRDDYLRVIDLYRQVYLITPHTGYADDAIVNIAILYEAIDEPDYAIRMLEFLLSDYPGSRYVGQARDDIERLGGAAPQIAALPDGNDSTVWIGGIRHFDDQGSLRVVVDMQGTPVFTRGRADNPPRTYIDIHDARLGPGFYTSHIDVGTAGVDTIRVAQNDTDTVRLVLDFNQDSVVETFTLADPDRLVIDVSNGSPASVDARPAGLLPPPAPGITTLEEDLPSTATIDASTRVDPQLPDSTMPAATSLSGTTGPVSAPVAEISPLEESTTAPVLETVRRPDPVIPAPGTPGVASLAETNPPAALPDAGAATLSETMPTTPASPAGPRSSPEIPPPSARENVRLETSARPIAALPAPGVSSLEENVPGTERPLSSSVSDPPIPRTPAPEIVSLAEAAAPVAPPSPGFTPTETGAPPTDLGTAPPVTPGIPRTPAPEIASLAEATAPVATPSPGFTPTETGTPPTDLGTAPPVTPGIPRTPAPEIVSLAEAAGPVAPPSPGFTPTETGTPPTDLGTAPPVTPGIPRTPAPEIASLSESAPPVRLPEPGVDVLEEDLPLPDPETAGPRISPEISRTPTSGIVALTESAPPVAPPSPGFTPTEADAPARGLETAGSRTTPEIPRTPAPEIVSLAEAAAPVATPSPGFTPTETGAPPTDLRTAPPVTPGIPRAPAPEIASLAETAPPVAPPSPGFTPTEADAPLTPLEAPGARRTPEIPGPTSPETLPLGAAPSPVAPPPPEVVPLEEEVPPAGPGGPDSLRSNPAAPRLPTPPEVASLEDAAPPRAPRRTEARIGDPAQPIGSGDHSLVRSLGLKVGRVVIDPGHGGRDGGTTGPTGLTEKDLVLDIALRLKEHIESKLGADVVLTRSDDRFVSLEERTTIANNAGADLFLSIHANSSRSQSIRGFETYVLNVNNNSESMEIAARENASSQKSISELQGIVQQIMLQDKLDESREFATHVQNSLADRPEFGRNRGVKEAPFMVLVGAKMPSILAEISFISNPEDEEELWRPERRQEFADALFEGVRSYSNTLSTFRTAQVED